MYLFVCIPCGACLFPGQVIPLYRKPKKCHIIVNYFSVNSVGKTPVEKIMAENELPVGPAL
jgi:hypothetical protein